VVYLLRTEKAGKGKISAYQAEQLVAVLKMMRKGGGNRGYQEATVMTLLTDTQKKELCRMFSHPSGTVSAPKPSEPKGSELNARIDALIELLELKGSKSAFLFLPRAMNNIYHLSSLGDMAIALIISSLKRHGTRLAQGFL